MNNIEYLKYGDDYLSYIKKESKLNKDICIIFFSGLMSGINSTKSEYFFNYCSKNDIEYIAFDYFGHGHSSGDFIDGTIGGWLSNCLNIVNNLTDKKIIIIGSSLGGWLSILAAEKSNKISAIITLSNAADFTEDLIWNELSKFEKEKLLSNKKIAIKSKYCDNHYDISLSLVEEARNHLILNRKIKLNIPIILVHGTDDLEVPFYNSINISESIDSDDIIVVLIKGADHSLNRKNDLDLIAKNLDILIDSLER